MDLKLQEELLKASKDAALHLETVSKSQGALKEAQVKVEENITAILESQKTFQEETATQLLALTKQNEEDNATAFDVVVNQPSVLKMHGYHDPVSRALYKSHTDYTPQGFKRDEEGYDLAKSVYELNDQVFLFGMAKALQERISAPNPRGFTEIAQEMDTYKLLMYELNRIPDVKKALSSGTAGSGAEWVPTGMSSQIIDDIRLALEVPSLFPSIVMPAKAGSFDYPLRGARQDAYLVSENTSDSGTKIPAGTPPSGKVTFTAVTHALRMLFSYIVDEDSLIAIFPLVRAEIVQSIVDARENAYINGQTTAFDADVTAATDVRKSYNGLRQFAGSSAVASAQAAVDIATLSLTNLRAIRKKMGRFGAKASALAYITSISAYVQMLSLTQVETADKWGSGFTAKAGELAQLDGSPIVISEFMPSNLNASGVYDGSTMTKTGIILANTKAHWGATKPSGLMIESARDIETQQNIVVASQRNDFQRVNAPNSGEATVGLGYNLTA